MICRSSIASTLAVLLARFDLSNAVRCGGLSLVQRIINGSKVGDPVAEYSFFALPTAGSASDYWLGCGATIISPTWAMSAAHCFGGGLSPCTGPTNISLWLGDVKMHSDRSISNSGDKYFRVKADLYCHTQFDGKCSHGHDIALLKIQQALPDWVKPVHLNLDGAGKEGIGEVTTNIGFGYREDANNTEMISSDTVSKLRQVKLKIMADDMSGCATVYAGGYGCSDDHSEGSALNKNQQLCAGAVDAPERDTCAGDSGGPMLDSTGVQVGIVSYGGGPGGKMTGPGRICADPQYLGVYTRISAFKGFIKGYVKDLP